MPDFVITAENNQQIFRDQNFKDSIITYQFDFSPWAKENNPVTTVTWTVKSGQVSIAGQTLAVNVASAQITLSEAGGSLVEIKAETGTETYIAFLDILTLDQERIINDYGFIRC